MHIASRFGKNSCGNDNDSDLLIIINFLAART